MLVETRPFTDEERKLLSGYSKDIREQNEASGFLLFLIIWAVSQIGFLLVSKIFPAISKYQPIYALCVLVAVFSFYLVHKYKKKKKGKAEEAWFDSELRDRMAEVATFDVTDAVEVEELEDEGLHFYLALEPGKVLFLSGQDLYEYVKSKQFPSTRLQIVRATKTRAIIDIKSLGKYLPPSIKLPSFRLEEFENGDVPMHDTILDLDIASLKSGKTKTQ